MGHWRSEPVVEQGWAWGVKLPLQSQDEEATVGLSCAVTSDIWGRVQRAAFSPCSHTFEKLVTKILGSYHYFMVFMWFSGNFFNVSYKGKMWGVSDLSLLFQIYLYSLAST